MAKSTITTESDKVEAAKVALDMVTKPLVVGAVVNAASINWGMYIAGTAVMGVKTYSRFSKKLLTSFKLAAILFPQEASTPKKAIEKVPVDLFQSSRVRVARISMQDSRFRKSQQGTNYAFSQLPCFVQSRTSGSLSVARR
ncbi:hypothetical protein EDB80DRAFT_881979 [Ilyonectria destructans]|nr:hypothetical protein EDB80DRAFT_881979 [Ilyonectria destructans]